MNNLYTELATVYEAMYHTFIDYHEEFQFYSSLLKKYHKTEVIEIGCGTGNLANYFLQTGFQYSGMDLSEDMIEFAREKTTNCEFLKADMRDFQLEQPIQSALITARTISYLLTNKDVKNAFDSIAKNLEKGGLLCFDIIDANQFVRMMKAQPTIEHYATANQTDYVRKSHWKLQMSQGVDFLWDAIYYKKEDNRLVELGRDYSNVRAFTVNEIEIFLFTSGFQVKEIIERPSYFFPTYVFVAEKK